MRPGAAGLSSPQPEVAVHNDVAWAATHTGAVSGAANGSVALGYFYENDEPDWSKLGSAFPDGSYALIRNSEDRIEVVSDPAGVRTIWYLLTDDLFIASTSQRAIIMMVGSLEFDERVIPWMLSTGAMGPEHSWDKRIRRLQPASTVVLDKKQWTLDCKMHCEVRFEPDDRPADVHEREIRDALEATFATLGRLTWPEWALPLSGGSDSRCMLCLIGSQIGMPDGFRTVTWGIGSSRTRKGNDALVAGQVAEALGVRNDYLLTELSSEPAETMMDRYIVSGEGRIDHFGAYADGLDIWRRLYDDGIRGIIRGDSCFGYVKVTSELGTRLCVEGAVCSDFENLKHVPAMLGQPEHRLPDNLQRQERETLEMWRDRLYHAFLIPTMLGALSDIKLAYVEQVTPLISRRLLRTVRTLPDHLRTGKVLYKQIVRSIGPDFGFATSSALADVPDIVDTRAVADLMRNELSDSLAKATFGPELTRQILGGIAATDAARQQVSFLRHVRGAIARRLSRRAKDILRATVAKPTVDGSTLALRAYMVARMRRMLQEDSERFRTGG
jgi:hypothetical protein